MRIAWLKITILVFCVMGLLGCWAQHWLPKCNGKAVWVYSVATCYCFSDSLVVNLYVNREVCRIVENVTW